MRKRFYVANVIIVSSLIIFEKPLKFLIIKQKNKSTLSTWTALNYFFLSFL